MSKELIEKLREKADSLTTTVGVMNLLHEAADALESNAAPVGEREAAIEAAYAAVVNGGWDSVKDMGIQMFQAGAAHQRQQAREVVMPDDLSELLVEIVDIHRRRGVVLTIHIEQIADMLARLNKGAGSHE